MPEITTLTPPNAVLRELGKRLASVRKQRQFSQIELAEQAGLGVATLKRIEGGSDSQLESWIKLLIALDMMEGINGLLPANHRSPMAEATRQGKQKSPTKTSKGWGDESA